MLIVAGFSFVLFVGAMFWRRHQYLQAAEWHAARESSYQEGRFWFVRSGRVQTLGENYTDPAAMYHTKMKRKYLDAASRPWMIVAPDPSPPDP
jgi:hypothetical protein